MKILTPRGLLSSSNTQSCLARLGITANPDTEPELFQEQCKMADPRYDVVDGKPVYKRERQELTGELPKDKKAAVQACAEEMFMLAGEIPLGDKLDAVIPLGAYGMSNKRRADFAAEAQATGQASFNVMMIACSTREISTAGEKEQLADFAAHATKECEVCYVVRDSIRENYGFTPIVDVADDPVAGTPGVIKHALERLVSEGLIPTSGARVGIITHVQYAQSSYWDAMALAIVKKHGIEIIVAALPSKVKLNDMMLLSEVCRFFRAAADAIQAGA